MLLKKNIAIFLALLFHVSGLIGILYTPYRNWFIQNTPLNLLLMFVLLLINQQKINKQFFFFLATAFITGMAVEIIGVNTQLLFGNYQYSSVLGKKIAGVPFLIGINWFVIVFCSCIAVQYFHEWVKAMAIAKGVLIKASTQTFSFVIDVALLTTFFDVIIEPVAIKLNFWNWHNHSIPLYNYCCWFVISSLLALLFKHIRIITHNYFAVHLFIIQLLFFVALRLYL
jgi:putative membrane protein